MKKNKIISRMEKTVQFYSNKRKEAENVLKYWQKLENEAICGLISEVYGIIWGIL